MPEYRKIVYTLEAEGRWPIPDVPPPRRVFVTVLPRVDATPEAVRALCGYCQVVLARKRQRGLVLSEAVQTQLRQVLLTTAVRVVDAGAVDTAQSAQVVASGCGEPFICDV